MKYYIFSNVNKDEVSKLPYYDIVFTSPPYYAGTGGHDSS
jgi:hypothetical protein